LLLALDRPVESDATPLALAPIPTEADVDSDTTLLRVARSPVEADVERVETALWPVLATA
jgi:hypothetical protein